MFLEEEALCWVGTLPATECSTRMMAFTSAGCELISLGTQQPFQYFPLSLSLSLSLSLYPSFLSLSPPLPLLSLSLSPSPSFFLSPSPLSLISLAHISTL